MQVFFSTEGLIAINMSENLHCPPEVSNWHSHGAVFVNVPKEIPEPQFVLVQIILSKEK